MSNESQGWQKHQPPSLSMATLLDNLPGMAYRCRNDSSRTVEFISDTCIALTGYPAEDIIGNRMLSYAELIHPVDRERVWHEVETALKRGERFQLTYRIQTPAGEVKWLWEQGVGISGPDGHVEAIEGYITGTAAQVQVLQELEERVSERTRELVTLLEISRNLAATLELEPLLNLILDEVRAAVDYSGAGMLLLEGDELVQLAGRGPDPKLLAEGVRLSLSHGGVIREAIERGEPLVIPDVWSESPAARGYRQIVTERWLRDRSHIRAWVGVPLQFRARRLGLMVIVHDEPGHFNDHDLRLLSAVAAQASVAIENARLVAAARDAAALEERQRLARELHDAVTQTLFSASLIGDVLPTLWERNRQRGEEALEDLRGLTRGALAEMRTLLVELRPNALAEAPLNELVRHLADAVNGRTHAQVDIDIQEVPLLPGDVQLTFYRTAQEALNNVAKHSEATRVEVRLCTDENGSVQLLVRDNGRGFDPSIAHAGHFGMETMRERASAIDATLAIDSQPGRGTVVCLAWGSAPSEMSYHSPVERI